MGRVEESALYFDEYLVRDCEKQERFAPVVREFIALLGRQT